MKNLTPQKTEEAAGSEVVETLATHERVRLMRDGLINYSGVLVSAVGGLVLVPIMLKRLGPENYGLWAAVVAVSGLAKSVDFGIGWSVTREVAADCGALRDDTARFVLSAPGIYLAIGVAGASIITLVGFAMSNHLGLSPEYRELVVTVFGTSGVALLGYELLTFCTAVFHGLRRFDVDNLISATMTVTWTGGVIVLLVLGRGLGAIVVWQAVTYFVMSFVALAAVRRLTPGLRFGWRWPDWKSLKAHLPFSLRSQLAMAAWAVVNESGTVFIGLMLGAASIVPFHVGRRFPAAAFSFIQSLSSTLYPAASEHHRRQGFRGLKETLEVGTRWLIVCTLPIFIVLEVLAPDLLQAWLGEVPPQAARILRIISAAVLAEGVGVAALNVLWGLGAVATVTSVLSATAAISVVLDLVLLLAIGVTGPAWALLVSKAFSSGLLLYLVSSSLAVRAPILLRESVAGLFIPALASAIICYGTKCFSGQGWISVISSTFLGFSAYAFALYVHGSRVEEKAIARRTLSAAAGFSIDVYHSLRGALRGSNM